MSPRSTCRRHSPPFKIQVCQKSRNGRLVRLGAQEEYYQSDNPIQHSLVLHDRGESGSEEAVAAVIVQYQAKSTALERKVGQLTLQLDLPKKTPAQHLVSNHESVCIIDVVIQLPRITDAIYNVKRPHSSLGYVPPKELAEKYARWAS